MNDNGIILSVRELATHFETDRGIVKAVDGVSFDVSRGETLGMVGESGSGKTVTSLSLMRLAPRTARVEFGTIDFNGIDLASVSDKEMCKIRGRRIAMIFQDPMTSLNPFLKVSTQLIEATTLHLGYTRDQAYEHAVKMLKTVGIAGAEERVDNYPHQFSGGMRQRVMIAMALSCDPELLIADEPTTALDVTIQAQILELIKDLKARSGTSIILITHDLGVIAGMTDRVVVMYAGRIMEQAPTRVLFSRPANPYTIGLLKSIPDVGNDRQRELYQIPGMPPDLAQLPHGCAFQERCYRAEDICRKESPPLMQIDHDHLSRCHFANQVYAGSDEATAKEKQ
jgi:oligopeptide transport system ATP-binding protein